MMAAWRHGWRRVGGSSFDDWKHLQPPLAEISTNATPRDMRVDSLIITLAREPQLFANCSGSAPVRTARLSRAARPVSQLIGYLGLDSALPVAVAALPSDLFTGRGGGSGGGKTEAERLWWRRRWHWFG